MAAPAHGRILKAEGRAPLRSMRKREAAARGREKFSTKQPELKETTMVRDATEYQARVTNDAGILRGKIPSPLVRELGAKAGDYIVFKRNSAGIVTVSLSRTKGGAKRSGKASGGSKAGKRAGRRR